MAVGGAQTHGKARDLNLAETQLGKPAQASVLKSFEEPERDLGRGAFRQAFQQLYGVDPSGEGPRPQGLMQSVGQIGRVAQAALGGRGGVEFESGPYRFAVADGPAMKGVELTIRPSKHSTSVLNLILSPDFKAGRVGIESAVSRGEAMNASERKAIGKALLSFLRSMGFKEGFYTPISPGVDRLIKGATGTAVQEVGAHRLFPLVTP